MIHFNDSPQQKKFSAALLSSEHILSETGLLATAIVNMSDINGRDIPCRALLDSGASTNFISERFTKLLNLKQSKGNLSIGGIGATTTSSKSCCHISFSSLYDSTTVFNTTAAVLPKISDHHPANSTIEMKALALPEVQLADPHFSKPQKIDLLIGAGLFWNLLMPGKIKVPESSLILQETKLGWIVGGQVCGGVESVSAMTSESHDSGTLNDNKNLNELVQRFWAIDSCCINGKEMSANDRACDDHFNEHTRRNVDGSYSVRLPFSKDPSILGESFHIAMKRFYNLERKLNKQPETKAMYSNFINEYEQLKHLQLVHSFNPSVPHCFLPHHGIMKLSSTSTKMRVVFDASCKTSSGISLNDTLHSGPKLQEDLFTTMSRFRLFKYVVTGDIQKMYRQVHIDLPDSNFQLILWRENPDDEIKVLRLCTVTYGTAPGSYLAVKTLLRLASDEQIKFPLGAATLRKDFYVDDMMSGSNSVPQLREKLHQTISILKSGGFTLSKFCSNNDDVLSSIDAADHEKYLKIDDHDVIKTLGIIWQPQLDVFRFTYQAEDSAPSVTKRIILSQMARLFDPLGLVCPVITLAKIFYQDLWKLKFGWDEPLADKLSSKWMKYISQLPSLRELAIPRHVLASDQNDFVELHAFSDASEKAYGTCVYLRCGHSNGTISSRILCAKSRVAPTKTLTIARLELLAAKLMVDLVSRLKNEILTDLVIDKYYYWTDSLITLCWLSAEPHNWNVFVSHRVAKIQEETCSGIWRHVPGELNPADLISRGALPNDIAHSEFWFDGPTFLKSNESSWPAIQAPMANDDKIEEKRTNKFALSAIVKDDLTSAMNLSQGFKGTRRAFAYVIRFIFNTRNKLVSKDVRKKLVQQSNIYSKVMIPTRNEEEEAELPFIRNIQKSTFAQEYDLLKFNKSVPPCSRLANLTPFVDSAGIMRVGGRLKNANIPYNSKHQILLPKDHMYTIMLIRFFHFHRTFHAGPNIVLTGIRARYWPINGLTQTRSVINKCTQCFRMRPRFLQQIMGNLPRERLDYTNMRPFVISGVDFAGPLTVRHHIRCKVPKKVYVALFICFSTKAVHLELAIDLTTESFIRCLKRFIADRGSVKKIYSDNATNFKGTANQLRDVQRILIKNSNEIKKVCEESFVDWSFIPPRAPNFGGLWEASIKITKRLIRNVVGSTEITFDEMHTVVRQVAAIVNSRPITSISTSPDDLEPLTPGHFVYGGPPVTLPELQMGEENVNRVKMYQRNVWMFQQFWKRFRTEYFTMLQSRTKWLSKNKNIVKDTMVLIKDDSLPPLKWSLGRVIETSPDSDGVVRVLKIRTSTGDIDRAISGVAVLPIEDNLVELPQTVQGGEDVELRAE